MSLKKKDIMTNMIEIMWRRVCQQGISTIRHFVREILKRSQTTYTTAQIAIAYLFQMIKQYNQQRSTFQRHGIHCCGRRMFLASLMVASKFLHDKTYRNSAWASMAQLPVQEVNLAERVFLQMCQYRLYVSPEAYDQLHRQFAYQLTQLLGHHHHHHPHLLIISTNKQPNPTPAATTPSHYYSFIYNPKCKKNTAAASIANATIGGDILAYQHQQTHDGGAFASHPRDKRYRDHDDSPASICPPTSKRCKSSSHPHHQHSYQRLLGHI